MLDWVPDLEQSGKPRHLAIAEAVASHIACGALASVLPIDRTGRGITRQQGGGALLRLLIAALLCISCLGVEGRAFAQATPDTVQLEDLTWTELRDLIKGGTTTVILPVGAVEQSGPDMVLGKHDARVRFLSEKIARVLGHTLVAPLIAYVPEGGIDPPTSHMRFPGTLTVPPEVFRATLTFAAESLKLAGFTHVVLIGDHGGYQGDLRTVADLLNRKWAKTPARALYDADYYRAATTDFAAILEKNGFSRAEIGTHAGVADTSLSMAVAPNLVREERLRQDTDLDAAHGVYGEPKRSSAAMGQLGLQAIVDKSVANIRQFVKDR